MSTPLDRPPRPRTSPATTPVLAGFHPDPSVCRGPDGYYLATSSFEYRPGVPVHVSTDLQHWVLLGNALDRQAHLPVDLARGSSGVYAPTLRHHAGTFHLVTTDVGDTRTGHLLVTTSDPRLGWSDPVHLAVGPGIDPDLAWDEEGRCHLTWSAPGDGGAAIWQCVVDERTGSLLTEPRQVWAGTGGAWTEGPHLFLVDGVWYLVAAEGGTERGHGVVVARGPAPGGPFEADPANPVLSHRSTDHPVQNVGHADLVRVDEDAWAMVHLGVRPRGGTPGYHVNGRETFLTPVRLRDGWFRVDPDGPLEVGPPGPQGRPGEGFQGFCGADPRVLHPRWVAPGVFPHRFAAVRDGRLTLTALDGHQCALVTRVDAVEWEATAVLGTAGGDGRVVLRIDERHWFAVGVEAADVVVEARAGELGLRRVLGTRPATDLTVSLSCSLPEAAPGATGEPDRLTASASWSDRVVGGPSVDGRYLSTEVAGGFTGRMVGIEVTSGVVDVVDFRYAPVRAGHVADPPHPDPDEEER